MKGKLRQYLYREDQQDSSIIVLLNIFQFLVSMVIVFLPGLTHGAALAYYPVSLPKFTDPNNESGIFMDDEKTSWFGKKLLRLLFGSLSTISKNKNVGLEHKFYEKLKFFSFEF